MTIYSIVFLICIVSPSITGIEPIASKAYTVTGSQSLECTLEGYGVRLYIPEGALPPDTPPTELQITACSSNQYKLPEGYQIVSGIYFISFPREFLKPVTVKIQHCLDLTRATECSSVKFAVARTSQAHPPYEFEIQKDEVFTSHNSYGTIRITSFSLITTLWNWISRYLPDRESSSQDVAKCYAAEQFFRHNTPCWTLHVVVIPDLDYYKSVSSSVYCNHVFSHAWCLWHIRWTLIFFYRYWWKYTKTFREVRKYRLSLRPMRLNLTSQWMVELCQEKMTGKFYQCKHLWLVYIVTCELENSGMHDYCRNFL